MKPRVYYHRRPIPEPKDPAHFQILVDELESNEDCYVTLWTSNRPGSPYISSHAGKWILMVGNWLQAMMWRECRYDDDANDMVIDPEWVNEDWDSGEMSLDRALDLSMRLFWPSPTVREGGIYGAPKPPSPLSEAQILDDTLGLKPARTVGTLTAEIVISDSPSVPRVVFDRRLHGWTLQLFQGIHRAYWVQDPPHWHMANHAFIVEEKMDPEPTLMPFQEAFALAKRLRWSKDIPGQTYILAPEVRGIPDKMIAFDEDCK